MAFGYNPKDASGALPAGKYPASISSVEEKTAKSSGNPMLEVQFTVYPPNGGERTVYDYIVNPSTLWKMKRLAKALGKLDDFNAARFQPADYIGTNLTLDLDVQEDDQFGDKNSVKGYEPSTLGQPAAKPASKPAPAKRSPGAVPQGVANAATVSEDDIPFAPQHHFC